MGDASSMVVGGFTNTRAEWKAADELPRQQLYDDEAPALCGLNILNLE